MYSSRLSKFGTWVEGAGVLASRFFTGWCGGLGWCGDHPDATPPCSCFHTSWVYLPVLLGGLVRRLARVERTAAASSLLRRGTCSGRCGARLSLASRLAPLGTPRPDRVAEGRRVT